LEDIIKYSLPKLKEYIDMGTKIYDVIEKNIVVEPVGITPIRKEEGYFFIKTENDIYIYNYKLNHIISINNNLSVLETSLIKKTSLDITTTLETIKESLIIENDKIPNPAVYIINTKEQLPLMETILPISKRKLLKIIS
jgi:hypothetical protein